MIEKAQAKRAEQGDQDGAMKLQKAEKIGKEATLPAEMRDVAKEIKGGSRHVPTTPCGARMTTSSRT